MEDLKTDLQAFVKDTHEESLRWVNINGKLTETRVNTDLRAVLIKLVPGEGDVPEREVYYDTGKTFIPTELHFSWTRRDGGEWVRGTTELSGQGYAKDGKTALKGRHRRDDGSLGFRYPLAHGEDPNNLPERLQRPWILDLINRYDPAMGWPQAVTEEKKEG